jgi:hypothetical protein
MGSIPDEIIELFQFMQSFQPHYEPGVCSGSNRNEYQKTFLVVMRGRRLSLTT